MGNQGAWILAKPVTREPCQSVGKARGEVGKEAAPKAHGEPGPLRSLCPIIKLSPAEELIASVPDAPSRTLFPDDGAPIPWAIVPS